MSAFAVVNPRSGGGRTAREWPKIERALREIYPGLDCALTTKRGEASALVRTALEEGCAEIIAVGGDGTINEAVNGFFDANGPVSPDAVFTFVTSGTGGDFRKTFGIDAGSEAGVGALRNSSLRRIDIGRLSCVGLNGESVIRHFANIGSFGLSGVIVDSVNRARIAKLFGGAFTFAFHSARSMLSYREHMVRLRIDDVLDEIASVATVAVANGQYFGGGMRVAPGAVPDDGFFDVIVMGGVKRGVGDLRLLYTGAHLNTPGVRDYRGRKIVAAPIVETRRRAVQIEVDGESAGRLPATFEILPRALNLRAPSRGSQS